MTTPVEHRKTRAICEIKKLCDETDIGIELDVLIALFERFRVLDDVINMVWISLRRRSQTEVTNPIGYLATIILNEKRKHYKKNAMTVNSVNGYCTHLLQIKVSQDQEAEQKRLIENAFNCLSMEEQKLLRTRYSLGTIEGGTLTRTKDWYIKEYGIFQTEDQIRYRIDKIIEKLQKHLGVK